MVQQGFKTAGFILTAGLLFAQTATPPEPEYQGVAYYYDSAANKLTNLERQNASPAAKVKAFGYGGIKGTMEIPGEHSSVRFTADQKIIFVFKAPSDLDPQSLAQITALTPKKDHREITRLQSHGFMGLGGVKDERDKSVIAFAASKYSATSVQISPTQPLAPGEYAVSANGSPTLFCFGIDPAK